MSEEDESERCGGFDKIVRYTHFGQEVYVQRHLKGKRREHCLCWLCAKFEPDDRARNCPIASLLYAVDVATNLVTPVWECREFEAKSD
jgi:hypothetical protein